MTFAGTKTVLVQQHVHVFCTGRHQFLNWHKLWLRRQAKGVVGTEAGVTSVTFVR